VASAPEIAVSPTAEALAAEVANRAITTLAAAQAERGTASLVVTGGSILEQVFAALRDSPVRTAVDWSRVVLWWGDERFVPVDSPDRNDTAALRAGLDGLPFAVANIHRMPAAGESWGDDAEAAASAYASELAAAAGDGGDVPQFDVVLLGIGPDGHCASLFPNSPGLDAVRESVIAVRNSPKPPPTRVSLTFRSLDSAAEIWFVASGTGKAEAVALANSGADPAKVPSGVPRGRSKTLWLIDADAASELTN
jgi:6-phosphogluconolactonase